MINFCFLVFDRLSTGPQSNKTGTRAENATEERRRKVFTVEKATGTFKKWKARK
jgi:hypothetical protein